MEEEKKTLEEEKKEVLKYLEGLPGPVGHPSEEHNYRCTVCGHEMLVDEAIVDAGIGMANFEGRYYEGYMPKVGCPGCNNYTMECVDEE